MGPRSAVIAAGTMRVEVRDADITSLPGLFDALVSSDDNYLTHGGGVSAALWAAGGPDVQAEAARLPLPLRLGDVAVTSAGRLAARCLLHAVSVDLDASRSLQSREAPRLYRKVFSEAVRLGCRRLALPLVGSGAGRLNAKVSAATCFSALAGFLDEESGLDEVLVLALGPNFDQTAAALRERFEGWQPLEALGELAVRAAAPGRAAAALQKSWESFKDPGGKQAVGLVGLFHSVVEVVVATCLRHREERGIPALVGRAAEALAHPHPSLGHRVALLRYIWSDEGSVPADLVKTLDAANAVRNRLVHGQETPSEDDLGIVREAVRRSLSYILSHAVPGPAGSPQTRVLEARPAGTSDQLARGVPVREEVSVAVAASLVREVEGDGRETAGTESVRRLHRFLLDALDEEGRTELDRRLEDEGYRGTFEMRLLEYCVRVDDPAEPLREYCSRRRLRAEVERLRGSARPGAATRDALALELLEQFGFPAAATPVGLPTIRRALERGLSEVPGVSSVEGLAGLVVDGAARVERALRIVLRFFSQAAFRRPAEVLFEEVGSLSRGQSLDRLALGRLVELTVALDRLLRDREDPALDLFRRDFETIGLLRLDQDSLTAIRNNFSHFKEARGVLDVISARRNGVEFFRAALELLDSLAERRLFPFLISIREIRVDRWGRRSVVAVTDEGNTEFIFTDERLRPGEVYFMHPLSNPFRVDPILQPAGPLGCD